MRLSLSCCLVAGLCLLPGLPAQEPAAVPAARPAPFVAPATLDLQAMLPDPPRAGSLAALGDLQAVLQAQAWRTPEQVAWAKAVDTGTIWDFKAVLGEGFRPEGLPACAAFFARVRENTWQASSLTKKRYQRLRPPLVDPAITPCVPLPKSGSYPSGHSLQIYAWAGVLAELVPERREALFLHARRMAWGRVLGGVHFPTDLEGARILAEHLLKAYGASEDYRKELEACRRELEGARIRKAA